MALLALLGPMTLAGCGGGGGGGDDGGTPVAPSVTVTPADGASAVAPDATLRAVFSEAVDAATVGIDTFHLQEAGGGAVPATVSYDADSRTALLQPEEALSYGIAYQAVLTTGIRTAAGDAVLDADRTWSFTTRRAEVRVSWQANREAAVNGDGGGYRLYYARTAGFDQADATVVNIPYTAGAKAPTSTSLALGRGIYYLRVRAYSALRPGGSVASAERSVTVR